MCVIIWEFFEQGVRVSGEDEYTLWFFGLVGARGRFWDAWKRITFPTTGASSKSEVPRKGNYIGK